MQNLCSSLEKAKGLGSARSVVKRWWHQRLTAIFMLPLSVWLIIIIKQSMNVNVVSFIGIIQKPYNTVAGGIFIIAAVYHGMLGIRVILDDYIRCFYIRFAINVLLQIFCITTIVAFILALFRVITV